MSGEELPEGWVETTIGDVLEFKYGKSLRGEDRDGGAFPVYGSSGEVGRHSEALTTGPTIIVGRKGSIGKVYFSPGPAFAIDTAYYIDLFGPFAPEYIAKWLGSARMDEMDRASAIPGLNRNDAYDLPVSVPPLPEQKRIVARLDALQARSRAAREALAEVPALLDTFRQSVLAAAFRGDLTAEWRAKNPDVEPASKLLERIRAERKTRWEKANPKKKYVEPEPVDDSDLPELPEGWCWVDLDALLVLVTSGSRGWAEHYAQAGATFIRAQDIKSDELRLDNVAFVELTGDSEGTRTRVQQHDVLVTITGANVAKTAVVRSEISEAYVSQHVALCRPCDPAMGRFLHRWLTADAPGNGRAQMLEMAYGGGKPGLNLQNLRDVVVPIPPTGERTELLRAVDAALARVECLPDAEVLARELDTLDQSILARAFRGELVDQDPNDEPAEALLARIRHGGDAAPARGRARRTG